MTDFRALCEQLMEFAEGKRYDGSAVIAKARAALAQPESQGVTDEDVVAACLFDSFHEPAEYHGWWSAIEWMEQRYGRPAIKPVPVRERPWEREGWCDADGQCWMGDAGGRGFVPSWRLCKPDDSCLAWSLPHWALPVPNSNSFTPEDQ